ncbi:MAG: hypothetical protein ACREQC_11285, partial [Candidatus Binataceae bacterium]
VLAMPIIPGLTDSEEDLDALARGARDAGALWFATSFLFLMPSALKQFMPFIEEKFPRLARRYHAWYGRHGSVPDAYRKEITERVENLRRKYRLGLRPPRTGTRALRSSPQLPLLLEKGA